MNVSLTTELEQFVQTLIASGQYKSSSEVIRAGLRLLKAGVDREERAHELQTMVHEARESYKQLDGVSADDLFAEIDRKQRARGYRK